MDPKQVVYKAIQLYNEQNFSKVLQYTFEPIFPREKFLENLFSKIGRIESVKLSQKLVDNKICILKYEIKTKAEWTEGYLLLVNEKQSWVLLEEVIENGLRNLVGNVL